MRLRILQLAVPAFLIANTAAGQLVYFVTNQFDSGPGSLRAVINQAIDNDTVRIQVTGTITLTSGSIVYNKDIVIDGPGSDLLSVSGNDSHRPFRITGGNTWMRGLTIRDGFEQGENGGGIQFTGDSLVLTDVKLRHCELEGNCSGSGLYAVAARVRMHDCAVDSNRIVPDYNTTLVRGVGAYLDCDDIELQGTTFVNNYGSVSHNGFTLQSTKIEGGGLLFEGHAQVHDCSFDGNIILHYTGGQNMSGTSRGGGICLLGDGSSLECTGTLFTGHFVNGQADGNSNKQGGAVYCSEQTVHFEDCMFTNNRCVSTTIDPTLAYGGAIAAYDSDVNIKDCMFDMNHSLHGSSVFAKTSAGNQTSRFSMQRSRVKSGQFESFGGAVQLDGLPVADLQEVEIADNPEPGLHCTGLDTLRVDRSLFTGNKGGAWLTTMAGNASYFLNTTFYRNIAWDYGGVHAQSNSTFSLINCTMVDDSVLSSNLYSARELHLIGSTVLLKNTVFAETSLNTDPVYGGISPAGITAGGNVCVDLSLTSVMTHPTDLNSTVMGLVAFGDHGGFTRTWSLVSNSPCIDHGGSDTLTLDQRGFIRDENTDSGAFEVSGDDPAISASLTGPGNVVCVNNVFSVEVTASSVFNITYQWRLNGVDIPNATSSTYSTTATLDDAGEYTCSMTNGYTTVVAGPINVEVDVCAGIITAVPGALQVHPVPFTRELTITGHGAGARYLVIRDQAGRCVQRTDVTGPIVQLDGSALSAGVYTLEMFGLEGRMAIARIVRGQ